jgi:PsbP
MSSKVLVFALTALALLVSGILNVTSNAFAQGETGQPNSTQAQLTTGGSNGNRSIAETIQFTHYIDPSGRFELDYPSDWTLFETDDINTVGWNSRNSTSTPFVVFTVSISPPLPSGVTVTPEQAIAVIRENPGVSNVTSMSEINLTNYSIGGQPAASLEVKHSISPQPMEELDPSIVTDPNRVDLSVVSILNNKIFSLHFSMSQEDYPTLLPVIDRIVESIKIMGL